MGYLSQSSERHLGIPLGGIGIQAQDFQGPSARRVTPLPGVLGLRGRGGFRRRILASIGNRLQAVTSSHLACEKITGGHRPGCVHIRDSVGDVKTHPGVCKGKQILKAIPVLALQCQRNGGRFDVTILNQNFSRPPTAIGSDSPKQQR